MPPLNDSSFATEVVVVTGAGRELGRSHAIEFARRGSRFVVNDLGGAVDGTGSGTTAQTVVDEIRQLGGEACGNTDPVRRHGNNRCCNGELRSSRYSSEQRRDPT